MTIKACAHVPAAPAASTSTGCQECLAMGDTWVHLRTCLHCGHVGCCDSSKNKHATGHFKSTGHAVVQSAEPGEDWRWCYVDERQVG
ncbi:UBP-type zinc finger domain-containing protein [Caenimonas sedimenti]|uniref:UBP-type zinc finger domain-containing protein n=1 Tax=Caenimonas sedimenti TaxID=2596921 RepID=A0A562ZFH2_9BURK|nr:UBP-type zinc finger domain-containing protein [Caenimonas sedimenti]TWO66017.1 UBP-type zinc finger domain-containing protein [Caenimonas sedimenti]